MKMDNRELDLAVPETRTRYQVGRDDLDAGKEDESIVPVETLE